MCAAAIHISQSEQLKGYYHQRKNRLGPNTKTKHLETHKDKFLQIYFGTQMFQEDIEGWHTPQPVLERVIEEEVELPEFSGHESAVTYIREFMIHKYEHQQIPFSLKTIIKHAKRALKSIIAVLSLWVPGVM